METEYTKMMEGSLNQFRGDDDEDVEAVQFLLDPKTFRSFGDGLTTVLEKSGYTGKNEIKEKSDYLLGKLQKIGSSTGIKTIKSWFDGSKRPKIQNSSRKKMYEICFALELSIEDTVCFFNHVYQDRCFNFHNIDETVYYFCLARGLAYNKAEKMISAINNAAVSEDEKEVDINFTKSVKSEIEEKNTEKELVKFLIEQKKCFEKWNLQAYKFIIECYEKILGNEASKPIISEFREKVKKGEEKQSRQIDINFDLDQNDEVIIGLIFKELKWDVEHYQISISDLKELLTGDLLSNAFLLKRLWIDPVKSFKGTEIPEAISNNFPSAKVLSNVLDNVKMGKSESYDSIRKVIVLFQFYSFWCEKKLDVENKKKNKNPDMKGDSLKEGNNENFDMIEDSSKEGDNKKPDTGEDSSKKDNDKKPDVIMRYGSEKRYGQYLDEVNCWLEDYGYSSLYSGNPYDWIFLHSAQSDTPLEKFRELMGILMNEDWRTE